MALGNLGVASSTLETSKLRVALRKGVVSMVGEKGVTLKVGDKAASYLTPLHAPDNSSIVDTPIRNMSVRSGR